MTISELVARADFFDHSVKRYQEHLVVWMLRDRGIGEEDITDILLGAGDELDSAMSEQELEAWANTATQLERR